jgi:DNA (cytosine-5)-methyltransferase 1
MTLTVGSLFSGIGGFDLGLERAGMKVIWQSEIDTFASKVLKKHWPDVPNLGDITKVDWSKIERPDVICGGYPCQPFSTAGKRGGENDARHLWPAMHNAICVLRPSYALMENVRGHLSLGFGRVLGDLAEIGYDTEWQVIPAAAVGAPHRRERVFIVAYPKSEYSNGSNDYPRIGLESQTLSKFRNNGGSQSLANASKQQFNGRRHQHGAGKIKQRETLQEQVDRGGCNVADTNDHRCWQSTSATKEKQERWTKTAACKCGWWEVEPDVGRVANGIPDRVDRLKGLGNAIVPQVAELVGALVLEHFYN